jgi:UDP-N-acetyl-D-glucosamine 2-epimerase, UDP-hydrolysing
MNPVMKKIQESKNLELNVLCAGTMLLPRFGNAVDIVEKDGFKINSKIYMEVEGSNPTTMSKSIGLGILEFSNEFNRIKPDIVLLIGDRYEALSAAIAAAYMNLRIGHIQGGEVSGSIDESCRHVISKLSHMHFPSTERSAEYIKKMGENPEFIFNVGCPSGDYIMSIKDELLNEEIEGGIGKNIDLNHPYLLVIFHPVTTKFISRKDIANVLKVLKKINLQTIWLWPNIDAGADLISTEIRRFRETEKSDWLYLIKNFRPEVFQKVLKNTSCAIGNSSSFLRDSTFTGAPIVLVGNRQVGREYGKNLVRVHQ